jgi:hypothetical protein
VAGDVAGLTADNLRLRALLEMAHGRALEVGARLRLRLRQQAAPLLHGRPSPRCTGSP